MAAGAREYEARVHDRAANRLAATGDAEGSRIERAAAKYLRRTPPARGRAGKQPEPLVGASHGVYRIYR